MRAGADGSADRARRAILVTGGAGYIGSHVCKALAEAGFLPVSFDDLSRGHEWAVKWGPLVRGSLLDAAALDAAMAVHRPEAIVHLAGFTYVGESVRDPLLYYANNVAGSLSLLAAAARHGIGALVFSSSAAVYGNPLATPIPESHPLAPINPYGFTKLAVERVLADLEGSSGLRSVSLRYFNAAGADPDGAAGEAHAPETHLIPLVLAAVRNGVPITLFGNDYDTPDGTCIRDYIHVTDLAAAHVLSLESLLAGGPSRALNLGTGAGLSVNEILAAAEEVTGMRVPSHFGPRRPGDPPRLVSDPTLARTDLGWAPRHSEIGTIIDTAWRWMLRP
jgi:UDP-arabinose 4-epimerase